jgi:hypothetical protein
MLLVSLQLFLGPTCTYLVIVYITIRVARKGMLYAFQRHLLSSIPLTSYPLTCPYLYTELDQHR